MVNGPDLAPRASLPEALRWGGWSLVLVCVLMRCLVTLDPFPYWAIDPGRVVLPITGLTPAASISVDSVMLVACGSALLGEVLAGATVLWLPVLLWTLGAVGVAVQAFVMRAGSIDDARIGMTWIAAFGAGLTAMHLCRDERVKRVTLAAGIGLIAMLAAKGAVQVFLEHEMTVQRYRADREGFLASQGWTPGSASALNFERRLNQPEATGWFGMSNVYATFAAVSVVALIGSACVAWREARVRRRLPDGWAGVLTIGVFVALGALFLAGSKGGSGVAILGIVLLGLLWLVWRKNQGDRDRKVAGLAAVGLVALAVAAVVARGLVGTRIGELSLLFRWFYMQGAVRAFAENPLFGTGPDGFKDAYMRLKPALSPEEVSSPHSVFFDLVSRLGVFGVLWAGLWLRWVYGLGMAVLRGRDEIAAAPGNARSEGWYTSLVAAVPVLLATWFEREMASPEQAAARVAGLAGWVGLSLAVLSLLRVSRAAVSIVAIAVLVAVVHSQIEVTALWDASAAWVCVMMGAAGAGAIGLRRRSRRGVVAPALLVVAAATGAWLGVRPASAWEAALRDAADRMRPMAEIRQRLVALTAGQGDQGDSMPKVLRDLASATDTPFPASPQEMERAMARLVQRSALAAGPFLEKASRRAPRHFSTRETWVRVLMEAAVAADASGQGTEAEQLARQAESSSREFVRHRPTAAAYGLVGNVESALFSLTTEPAHLDEAIRAWEAGARLDPHGLSLPLQAFRAMMSADRKEAARALAPRLLELDQKLRLDELKRLSPEDRAAVERVLQEN